MSGIPPRMLWLLGVLLASLLVAPALLGKYGLSVLILVLYFAYVGQAWNIMMGFAGQLSLGHALYAGLGGYIAAGLFLHYGLGPWAGEHDPGWELVGPEHATLADAEDARRLEAA